MQPPAPAKLAGLDRIDGLPVPWVTWRSGETVFSVDRCPHGRRLSIFARTEPSEPAGPPVYPHLNPQRCREAVYTGRCAFCGHPTTRRWAFDEGRERQLRGFNRYVLERPALCYTCVRYLAPDSGAWHPYLPEIPDGGVFEILEADVLSPVMSREEVRLGFPGLARIIPADEVVVGMVHLVVRSRRESPPGGFLAGEGGGAPRSG